jgi:site-specific DNA recombinase
MNEQTTKRVAIYARSATTSEQGEVPSSIDRQVAACRLYCSEKGYAGDERHIYQEVSSGAEYEGRPQLTALRLAARNHEFEVLVILCYDRLARNYAHQAVIVEELAQVGVTVESVQEPFENSQLGEFQNFVHACLKEMERERRSWSARRGKAAARQRREGRE